ncbi:RNA polymerase sigma factor [Micromonospora peucetia]|uniref:RNA polymerase sigma factor n=1 Tax=Micromonospora peucetia TaxID=47871 RepID=UPI000A4B2D34|nr:sigma-70 family RNA polymerase sigma factor [Micromonospora peucetia]
MGAGQDEHAVFARVYSSSYHLVLRYCYRRTGDMESARELTQETFVVAWRRHRDAPESTMPWLYGIARRVLADHWRARRVRPVTVPMTETFDVMVDDGGFAAVGLAQDVRRAFAGLSESDREVLRLVTWEDLDLSAAARVLGCSRPAAAVRLFRARQRLARLMDDPPVVRTRKAPATVRGGVR